jgi:hypothetical protein
MFKLPDFPSIDFSKLDVDALRNVDFSKFVPNVDLAAFDGDKLTAAVRDAAYVTIGLGVLAVQQAQVARREFVQTISERFGESKTYVESLLSAFEANLAQFDERANAAEVRVDTVVDKIGDILPEQAGALLGQARDFTRVAGQQVRGLIRSAA